MLVYLDTAQLSALDELLRRHPAAFAAFLEFWADHECELVLSRAHLHELGQREHESDVKQRLEMLRYFSIRSGDDTENVDWVLIREIREQTLNRLRTGREPAPVVYAKIREELYRPISIGAIEAFLHRVRPGLLYELETRRAYARHENRSKALRKAYRDLTKKKEPKWGPNASKVVPVIQKITPYASGADPVADRWMKGVNARMADCSKATRKRQAMICTFDLEGMACLEQAPDQDLHRIGFYRALGRHWVVPYGRLAGYDPGAIEAALDLFDPYDAPGISISLAVERGRKSHEKPFEASDYMDVDHVLWAAYSDIAFVDRRTHGFMLQARKTPSTSRILSPHITTRFERAADLDEARRHISRLAEDRLNAG